MSLYNKKGLSHLARPKNHRKITKISRISNKTVDLTK